MAGKWPPRIFVQWILWIVLLVPVAGNGIEIAGSRERCAPSPLLQTLVPDTVSTSVSENARGNSDGEPSSIISWMEKHPVTVGFIGVIIGAIVTIWVVVKWQRRTPAKEKQIVYETKIAEKTAEQEWEKQLRERIADKVLSDYLIAIKNRHEKIHLFGFQSSVNIKVQTLQVFVPLRFTQEFHGHKNPQTEERYFQEQDTHLTADKIFKRMEESGKRLLLIVGDPGSGKTTLLKYLLMSLVEHRNTPGTNKSFIPVLLPLSKVDPDKPFTEMLSEWGKMQDWEVTPEVFKRWLKKPGALIMLDGLDEIGDIEQRKRVCRWIDNAHNTHAKSWFIVTTRYTGWKPAEGVDLASDYLRADVLDLDRMQQEEFLKKWFGATYGEELRLQGRDPESQSAAIEREALRLVNAVLEYLDREENEGIKRLAGNPMLLQIMAILWKEYGNLPPARAELFSRCIDYLLERRDRAPGRDLPVLLPASKAKLVLRPLCLWMQLVHGQDDISTKKLIERIKPQLQRVSPNTTPEEFIENLRDRAALLQEFGADGYIFRHKSFREYLAGLEMAHKVHRRPSRAALLVKYFGNDWWRETILFAIGVDEPVIFEDFFKCFLPHRANSRSFPALLEQMVRESQSKSTGPFRQFVLDRRNHWQKRYNALMCLRLIGSDSARELVHQVWERERESRVKAKAEEILIEWGVLEPEKVEERVPEEPVVSEVAGVVGQSKKWHNPLELNAEYILIPGATESIVFDSTGKPAPEYPVYFARYPVTNKLYRRFIAYLAEDPAAEDLLNRLPLPAFAQSLLAVAPRMDEDFVDYLGSNAGQWAQKLRSEEENNKRFNGEDRPVVGVSWYAAAAYCHWLTELHRRNGASRPPFADFVFRLPTEEEWEWAAGGGKREYPWGDEPPDETRANYDENVGQTTPVGAYPAGATPEGLMDMAGNVWEWMKNRYRGGSRSRSVRGGSWVSQSDNLRCSARNDVLPGPQWPLSGFRVVLCARSQK